MLVSRGTSALEKGLKMIDLLRRPQVNYEALAPFDKNRPDLPDDVFEQVEIDIKYEGYLKRQQMQINDLRRLEVKRLPNDLDYNDITGLRLEAIEKLNKIRPTNIGQASRISGVSPADVSVLIIYLSK
jgi:tRNA uridine 5-carboxymethylaminomethyl modification enzyme